MTGAGKMAPGGADAAGSTPGATRPNLNPAKHVLKRSGPMPGHRLPPHKVALIHVAKAQVGMAEEVYRQMLREIGGVSSSVGLSNKAFAAVMDRFKALGFVHINGNEPPGLSDDARRPGMATLAQRKYIRGLWRQWHGVDDGRALRRWLQRKFHVADLRFATVESARMAIEGLKAMVARKSASSTSCADRRQTEE